MDFGDYLCEKGCVTRDQLADGLRRWPGHTDTVGALGLKLGFLDMLQIDALLDEQSRRKKLFGELAVDQGFMTPDQVRGLLDVQRVDRSLDLGKVLIVCGHLTPQALIEALAGYMAAAPDGAAA
jgi:hypothetical protein